MSEVTREIIVEWILYPTLKSRLLTYFWKLVGLGGGEVWSRICEFEIGQKPFGDCYIKTYEFLIYKSVTGRLQVWLVETIREKK